MEGFTLVELLIVVSILAILLSLAVPAFGRLVASVRIRAEASNLMSAVHLTRSEAIKRNRKVSLCPYNNEVSPGACTRDYADGWVVFVNPDRDRELDEGEQVLARGSALPAGFNVSNRKGNRAADELITYYGDGSSRRNLTLMVCSTAHPGVESWSVVLNLVGRPRMARDWGECPTESLPGG
jgi:type IV fimbrial biogenesis protein FimT